MRMIIAVLISIAFTPPLLIGAQRVVAGTPPAPYPPPNATATFFLDLPPGYEPKSSEQLCDSSTLIVDAYVQSVLPPRQNGRRLETDAIVLVNQVLKGSDSIQQVVISQRGGYLDNTKNCQLSTR